jgi:hypothetical protein
MARRGYGDVFPDVPGRKGIHSAGGGASVDAPPWRPGHVGHTPQAPNRALINARVEGILSSATALAMPVEFAMQNFGQPQAFERPSHVETLLALEDFSRRSRLKFVPRGPMQFRDTVGGPPPPPRTS